MTIPFELHLTSYLPIGDLVARLTLASGTELDIVLRQGRYKGLLPDAPVRLRLLADEAPAGEAELRVASEDDEEEALEPPEGTAVAFEELFENGIAITERSLRMQLVWGLHCHTSSVIAPRTAQGLAASADGTDSDDRFGTWEHIQCAAQIGLRADQSKLVLKDGFLDVLANTPLPIGSATLARTFGEIIALAGDYFAYLDEQARLDCPTAWPKKRLLRLALDYTKKTLAEEDPAVVADILDTAYRERDVTKDVLDEARTMAEGLFGRYPVRRYLALASQNVCHFRTQPGTPDEEDVGALKWYRYYHERALRIARAAGATNDREWLKQALVCDAFGCHFLTDLFAAGHMRVPRRVMGEQLGLWRGGLGLAHKMHCEDNASGLWCTTSFAQTPRRVWLAFGDAMLFSPRSQKRHLRVVQEAVRRSVEEIACAYDGRELSIEERAQSLLPVPLPPGEAPRESDVLPLSTSISTRDHYDEDCPLNAYPMVVYLREQNLIACRCGDGEINLYRDITDRMQDRFSIDFSDLEPRMGSERIPRLT